MNYDYEDITEEPNIETSQLNEEGLLVLVSGIAYDIQNSEMTNKSYQYATWWEDDELLRIVFTTELSSADKAILDGIVGDNS